MYCPKCGTQNVEDAGFCRACGLDLSTIARVMEKHLPLALLEKIDEQILNPKKSELYNSFLAGLLAIVLLVVGYGLSGWKFPIDAAYFFTGAAFSAFQAVWHFLIYVRSRSKTKMVLTTADYLEAAGLTPAEYEKKHKDKPLSVVPPPAQIAPPASVTEPTVNLFEAKERETKKLQES